MLVGDLLCMCRAWCASSSQAPSSDTGEWEGDLARSIGSEPCDSPCHSDFLCGPGRTCLVRNLPLAWQSSISSALPLTKTPLSMGTAPCMGRTGLETVETRDVREKVRGRRLTAGRGDLRICEGKPRASGWRRWRPSSERPAAGAGECPGSAACPPTGSSPTCMVSICQTPASTTPTLHLCHAFPRPQPKKETPQYAS
jgi:hypothetical protein